MIKIRQKNQTSIQYNIIVGDSPLLFPMLPPRAFHNDILEFVKRCPFDLIQLNTALNYYELSKKSHWKSPLDLNIINIKDFNFFFDENKNVKQVQLFFFNSEESNHLDAYHELIKFESVLIYSHLYNSKNIEFSNINSVISPNDFIIKLIKNQQSILSVVGFPKNRTDINSNLLILNSNCHNEKQQI